MKTYNDRQTGELTKIECNKAEYEKMVAAGKWTPNDNVKWHAAPGIGVVSATVKMQGGETKVVQIYIVGYFPPVRR